MNDIERFAKLGFFGDPEDEEYVPSNDTNDNFDDEADDIWDDEKPKRKPILSRKYSLEPDEYKKLSVQLLPLVERHSEIMASLADEIGSDGINRENENVFLNRIAYTIISGYKMLRMFPNYREILGVKEHIIEAYDKAALAYAVNKNEFNIIFENNYTKITVPRLHSNHAPVKYRQIRYYYYHDNLVGLFEKHKDKIPYFKYARIVVDSPGMVDNDNIELHHLINSLKGYFISSDEGYRLDIDLLCSGKLTETNEIYIMNKVYYPDFVAENKELYLSFNDVNK